MRDKLKVKVEMPGVPDDNPITPILQKVAADIERRIAEDEAKNSISKERLGHHGFRDEGQIFIPRRYRSIPHSYRGEGVNFID